MTPLVSEERVGILVDELKKLRQGHGAGGPLGDKLTTTAMTAFGVHGADDEDTARAKVFSRLRTAAETLSADHQAAVVAAFGLGSAHRGRYYKDRLRALAIEREVDPRTVRRWVDRALEPLARSLLALGPDTNRGPAWWTDELSVALVLDQPAPEALEIRRVIAIHDGLTELELAVTITAADAGTIQKRVDFDVFYGGTLRVDKMESSDRVRLVLALPRSLRQGEAHEYAVRTRLPVDLDMRQHYVCVPKYRCAKFELRVRFPSERLPTRVSKLANAYQRDIDDPATTNEEVPVDSAGEAHVRFADLELGQASGLRWQY